MKKSVYKQLIAYTAAILLTGLLTGCMGPQYTEEEEKAAREAGRRIVEVYLEKNVPDSRLVSLDTYKDKVPSGPEYLTDYVEGEYQEGAENYRYFANRKTGEIYSSKHYEELQSALEQKILKLLDLPEYVSIRKMEVQGILLPDTGASSSFFIQQVLPMEAKDVDAYVSEPESRLPISLLLELSVPDAVSLKEKCNLTDILKREEAAGLAFSPYKGIIISNDRETLQLVRLKETTYQYERWADVDMGDFMIRVRAAGGGERMDQEGNLTQDYQEFDPEKNLKIEKTSEGYQIRYLENPDSFAGGMEFWIIAEAGSEILKYEYDRKPAGGSNKRACEWMLLEDGRQCLNFKFSQDFDLIIRDSRAG